MNGMIVFHNPQPGTLANLKTQPPGFAPSVYLEGRERAGDGGEGMFVWERGDHRTHVATDPNAGVYVPPNSDPTGESGCWVRAEVSRGEYRPEWFASFDQATQDATAAIQAAIRIASVDGGGIVLLPAGTWKVSDTLTVPAGVAVRVDRGATIKATTDADVVELAMNSRIEGGGTIDISAPVTFTSAGLHVTGTAKWWSNSGHALLADDIRIIGNKQNKSAAVRYTCTDGKFVSLTRMARLSLHNCYYGIHLDPVAGGGRSYLNGNEFGAMISGCTYPIYGGDTTAATEVDGNSFDVQIQTVHEMERAVRFGGRHNSVFGMLWDFSASTAGFPAAIELTNTSVGNYIVMRGLEPGNIVDDGLFNAIEPIGAWFPWPRRQIIPPHSFDAPSPSGNADDVLFDATERFRVAASGTPASGQLANLFRADPTSFCEWTNADTGSPQTITIDFGTAISGPVALGVQFLNARWATRIQLSLFDGAGWQTLLDHRDNAGSTIVAPIPANLRISNCTQVRVLFEGNAASKPAIRIARIFFYARSVAGIAYLPIHGGAMHGTVNFLTNLTLANSKNFQLNDSAGAPAGNIGMSSANDMLLQNTGAGSLSLEAAVDQRIRFLIGNTEHLGLDADGALRVGGNAGPKVIAGSGSPEGVVAAPVGSLFLRKDGGASTSLYVKENGTGNTGWIAK